MKNKSLVLIGLMITVSFTAFANTSLAKKQNKESQIDTKTVKVSIIYNDPRDPFEGFNRVMWHFNYRILDHYLYRPVAHGYRNYIPRPVKTGVNNFVLNFDEPSSMVNNMLQGKWAWAANAGGRFIINTTVGLLGLFDVADVLGMPRKLDAFNEVLGFYGMTDGPYIMVPFIGPYVTREAALDWVDNIYFPISDLNFWQFATKWGLENLEKRAAAIDQEGLVDNSLDPYAFVKEAYIQHLNYKVYDGKIPQSTKDDELLDDYMDELD